MASGVPEGNVLPNKLLGLAYRESFVMEEVSTTFIPYVPCHFTRSFVCTYWIRDHGAARWRGLKFWWEPANSVR
jgi:hypothetical protein